MAIEIAPVRNEPAMAALAAHGFVVARQLHRMRLGPPVDSMPSWLWTLASAGAG